MKRYLIIGFKYKFVASVINVSFDNLYLYIVTSRNVHSISEILYVNFILSGRIFCSVFILSVEVFVL